MLRQLMGDPFLAVFAITRGQAKSPAWVLGRFVTPLSYSVRLRSGHSRGRNPGLGRVRPPWATMFRHSVAPKQARRRRQMRCRVTRASEICSVTGWLESVSATADDG